MCWTIRALAILLLGAALVAMAGTSGAERNRAEIITKADSLFRQRYTPRTDKPLRTFYKDTELRPADAVVYWFDGSYVARLVFTTDGSLARVELFPEALLYSDSWASAPDAVELGQGEIRWIISVAGQLRPTGDPVSVHPCFQSGQNLYCTDSYESANVSTYRRDDYRAQPLPPASPRAVTIAYKQSVLGIVSEIKAVSGNEHQLKVGALWYRVLKDRDQQLFATAAVGSRVSLTTFGCAGNELTCDAFPPSATPPKH